LDPRQLLNLSLNWKSVFGSDFDASFFMTNALDEEYITFVSGLYNGAGAEFGVPGEPKMWGGRIKYNFN
jgi:iron complex outermembrane receptor protein